MAHVGANVNTGHDPWSLVRAPLASTPLVRTPHGPRPALVRASRRAAPTPHGPRPLGPAGQDVWQPENHLTNEAKPA
jgi:hypothetical protein